MKMSEKFLGSLSKQLEHNTSKRARLHLRTSRLPPTHKENTSKIETAANSPQLTRFFFQLAANVLGQFRRASTITDGACTGLDVSVKSHDREDTLWLRHCILLRANSSPAHMICLRPRITATFFFFFDTNFSFVALATLFGKRASTVTRSSSLRIAPANMTSAIVAQGDCVQIEQWIQALLQLTCFCFQLTAISRPATGSG